MDLIVFLIIKLIIGINLCADYLKALSAPLSGSSSSVINSIITLFSLRNIDQNDSSVKRSTQSQSSSLLPDDSIDIESTNLMSTFDNK